MEAMDGKEPVGTPKVEEFNLVFEKEKTHLLFLFQSAGTIFEREVKVTRGSICRKKIWSGKYVYADIKILQPR